MTTQIEPNTAHIYTLQSDRLRALARTLDREGRSADALAILELLAAGEPPHADTLTLLVQLYGKLGESLKAIQTLNLLKTVTADPSLLLEEVNRFMPAAIQSFNENLAGGHVEEAEKYAASLAALIPGNVALLNSALSCNIALGRKREAANYAAALIKLDATHEQARAVLADIGGFDPASQAAIDQRVTQALAAGSEVNPLVRLRDLFDAAGLVLCQPLTDRSIGQIEQLVGAARALKPNFPPDTEWAGWAKHYRVATEAIDLPAILGPTPVPQNEPEFEFATAAGAALDWAGLKKAAKSLSAQVVFFAAADRGYLDLYARWFIDSVLKHSDVPCMIIVHAIGEAGKLRELSKTLGYKDKRVFFSADRFDAAAVTTKCYDTPPKGMSAKPVAHFQSARFIRLGTLLQRLKLPVFVSDIDLLLQRGVSDLLARSAKADVVLNENTHSTSAGSRFTANLVLVNPTDNADLFLRFLRCQLEKSLARDEVSRWIDQFVLLHAHHHLKRHGRNARIEYFDTSSDINNVMYRSYQEHPFRFLCLYHGFDMSSLESGAATAPAGDTEMPKQAAKPVRPKRKSASSNRR